MHHYFNNYDFARLYLAVPRRGYKLDCYLWCKMLQCHMWHNNNVLCSSLFRMSILVRYSTWNLENRSDTKSFHNMASAGKQRCLRRSFTSDEIDTNLGFKLLHRFPNEKLPSKAEVIGYGVHMLDTVWYISYDTVIHSTATALRNHWIERNVYPFSLKVVILIPAI